MQTLITDAGRDAQNTASPSQLVREGIGGERRLIESGLQIDRESSRTRPTECAISRVWPEMGR